MKFWLPTAALLLCLAAPLSAEPPWTPADVRAAVARALPLIQKAAAGHMAHRDCFACHHQAVPALAVVTARSRGLPFDEPAFRKHFPFIAAFLGRNRENYLKGQGQGGQADTAAYALWTLELGGWKADATTAAVAEYLLRRDRGRDHWRTTSDRPPSETSPFTTTCLAVRALQTFGTPEQKGRIDERLRAARAWLTRTPARDTEDRVFRLWGLRRVGAGAKEVGAAARELLKTQRPDGGWAQRDAMQPDAYATGTALVALHEAAGLAADDPAYRRGVAYVMRTQLPDGSWHVRSRSRPFQTYFESGFPHGKDQFISLAATSWATTALALALPPAPDGPAAGGKREAKTLRVYFVGNSVTDTIRYGALGDLAKARGDRLIWGRHMIPGAPLAWIWKHPDSGFNQPPFGYYPKALTKYEWDVLCLQPFDRLLSWKDGGDECDVLLCQKFIKLARKKSPDVRVYVYERWPRRDDPKKGDYCLDYAKKWVRKYTGHWDGTNETRDYFERLTERLTLATRGSMPGSPVRPVLLVPAGDVLYEVDRRMRAGKIPGYRDVGQLYADGIHLNDAGSYVVGCTFFATLFKQSPVGLPAAPYKVRDERFARAVQETVWEVVRRHPLAGVAPVRPAAGPAAPYSSGDNPRASEDRDADDPS
jgi:hypothetical protein